MKLPTLKDIVPAGCSEHEGLAYMACKADFEKLIEAHIEHYMKELNDSHMVVGESNNGEITVTLDSGDGLFIQPKIKALEDLLG